MDFALRIQEALASAQGLARELMTDTLRCERPTGRTVRVDGKTVPEMATVWPLPGQQGRGKVQSQQAYPSQPEAGGGTVTLLVTEVHIPTDDGFPFRVDDVFVVESSRDPSLPGRRFRYRTDPAKTHRTARRFNCEEVQR